MDMKTCIIVGAGGRGKNCYAPYIKEKNLMKIVGVADPDEKKRCEFQKDYGISDDMCFSDYRDLFKRERLADAVLICTQDKLHIEPTRLAVKRGYHILLEKPIATTEAEVLEMEKIVKGYDKVFMTGFVLRHTPFIKKIKEIIASGEIGEILAMQLNENEGFWHHAHSYVRGPWNNEKTSAPLIVAKSCHDFDLMLYLVGDDCTSVASYGENSFFKSKNAPEGATARCTDCPHKATCIYNAERLYTDGPASYFLHTFAKGKTREEVLELLKTSRYGRCVFHCDNNVCDHQTACLEFRGGATAMFTVSAFSRDNTRTIKLMGTKGEIGGCMELGEIVLKRFATMEEETFHITHDGTKHCGGDGGLMDYFAEAVNSGGKPDELVFPSHKAVFASEKSRRKKRKIKL